MTVIVVVSIFKGGGGRGEAVTKRSSDDCSRGGDMCRSCLHFMGMMDGVEHRAEQESQGVTRGRMTKR